MAARFAGGYDGAIRILVITHPYRADQAAVRAGTGAARASRMAASAVREAAGCDNRAEVGVNPGAPF